MKAEQKWNAIPGVKVAESAVKVAIARKVPTTLINVMGDAACFKHGQITNIPIAAANIAIVVITTTTRDSIELG